MSKRGQALVEFIIILPIFLLLLLGVVDMGRIMYSKIVLEEEMSNIINLYGEGKSTTEIIKSLKLDSDMTLEVNDDNDYLNFNLVKEIEILTPGLNLILNNPYSLKITRSIANDS